LSPRYGLGEFDIQPRLDGFTLGSTLAGALFAGLAVGIVPALQLSGSGLRERLQQAGRGLASGRATGRAMGGLVVAQIGLALALVVGAALLMQSFQRLMDEDRGFSPDGVLSFQVSLPDPGYAAADRKAAFVGRAVERLGRIPAVRAAGASTVQPLDPGTWSVGFNVEGRPAGGGRGERLAHVRAITPDYPRAMGIALLAGRGFTARDDASSEPVAIVSRSLAQRCWPGQDPIGRRVKLGRYDATGRWLTVVGVVSTLAETEDEVIGSSDAIYLPHGQAPDALASMTFVLKSGADPHALAGPARAAIRELDPDLPVYGVATLRERLAETTATQRLSAILYDVFAVTGLALAALGLYALLSFWVAGRRQEIGVRAALGAAPRELAGLFLRRAMALTALGLALGAAAALLVGRGLAQRLHDIGPYDPPTLLGAAALLAGVVTLASWLPVRRAARLDPMRALRQD
jgi:predicted permease